MKPKNAIILLILFLLAAVALLLLPNRPPHPRIEEDTGPKPLLDEDQLGSSVSVLRLFTSNNKQPDLVLVKKNSRWWVSMPHLFPARRSAIDELFSILAGMQVTPVEDDADERPDDEFLGRSLTIEYTDRPAVQINLGERSGAGRARVSLFFTGDASESDDTLHDYFDAFELARFYAKKIVLPIMPEIDRIDFSSIEDQSSLVQREGEWFIGDGKDAERALAQDLSGRAGIEQLFTVFDLLELSDAQSSNTPLASYGLEQPLASITLAPLSNAPVQADNAITISLGVPADPNDTLRFVSVVYDKDAPAAVFTAPSQYALLIAQTATNFRDPRVIATPTTLIQSISLKFGGRDFIAIELDAGNPPVLRPRNAQPQEMPTESVANMLRQLSNVRAIEYIPTQLAQWDDLVSVMIRPRLGGEPELFTVYSDPQSDASKPTVLVHRGKEPVALRVPRESVAGLLDPMSLIADDDE